jgi:beta-N-acetylhexosaminidase
MSDSRSAYDEQLPWLEAVDDEDGPSGIPARRMLAALLVVLLAAALVFATFFWLGRQNVADVGGAPELIRADPKPYKVKPTDPGGLDVAGESETAFQTSAGEDTDAQLDLSRMPEQAVAPPPKPVAEPKPAETPKPQPAPKPAEAAPGLRQSCAGGTRLVGAFSPLPIGCSNEQAHRPLLRRNPASRGGNVAGRGASGLPGAEGGRRELLRGELMQAAIYGLEGTEVSREESDFFRDADPAGFILFRRNCESRDQMRRMTDRLREIAGRPEVPILIDQEGGRVARMKPPEWPAFPCGEAFDRLYQRAPSSAIEAARVNARALALMLNEVGVNVDCLPMLDVRQPGASDIVGDRALGAEPMQVAALGRAILDGLHSAGVLGVVKHIPGHGRALVDSHHELPVVEAGEDELAVDLEPFERLRNAAMGMTSHLLYKQWDPDRPASQSPIVIHDIIRQRIGFDGFLMSDDIGMEALAGDHGQRAAACVAAGCDVALHCDGKMENMVLVAKAVSPLSQEAEARLSRAMAMTFTPEDGMDFAAAVEKRDALLAFA